MKTSRRSVRPLALAAVPLVLLAFGACSGGQGELADLDMPECDALVAAQRACASRAGLPPDVIEEQMAAMRDDFKNAAKDSASRTRVREHCAASTPRVTEGCR